MTPGLLLCLRCQECALLPVESPSEGITATAGKHGGIRTESVRLSSCSHMLPLNDCPFAGVPEHYSCAW